MAGGKLLGFLQNNPQIVGGVRNAVGGFLDSKGLGQQEKELGDNFSIPLCN